jgi:hypothetical protein
LLGLEVGSFVPNYGSIFGLTIPSRGRFTQFSAISCILVCFRRLSSAYSCFWRLHSSYRRWSARHRDSGQLEPQRSLSVHNVHIRSSSLPLKRPQRHRQQLGRRTADRGSAAAFIMSKRLTDSYPFWNSKRFYRSVNTFVFHQSVNLSPNPVHYPHSQV